MVTGMDFFFLLWFFILPILGIIFSILIPLFWFFIVPKVARMLTWKRFQKVSFHLVADDTGFAYLLPTTDQLPEGVSTTKMGVRFLPRRLGMKTKDEKERHVAEMLLRKFVWRDMGKPLWFSYAGKVGSCNPATLALLQQSKDKKNNPTSKIGGNIEQYLKNLPLPAIKMLKAAGVNLKEDLLAMLKEVRTEMSMQSLTFLNPTVVKLIPKMYTTSQMAAYGKKCEMLGMEKAGKQYTPLIIGAGMIVAIIVVLVIVLAFLKGGG